MSNTNTIPGWPLTLTKNERTKLRRYKKRVEKRCSDQIQYELKNCIEKVSSRNEKYRNQGRCNGLYEQWSCEETFECIAYPDRLHNIKVVYGYTPTDGSIIEWHFDGVRQGYTMM